MIFNSVNATTTHLLRYGDERHIKNALRASAKQEKILEVIQLTTTVRIHAFTLATPILQKKWINRKNQYLKRTS